MSEWYNEALAKLENDPQWIAEGHFLDLTETICTIHGKESPKGFNGMLFWILEWCANRLIWKARERP